MKVILVTGGFDPIHSGHISYLNHADHLGDHVVVGLNSDTWLERKKGRAFMTWRERMIVLDNLHMVGEVIEFDDSDDTAIDAIRKVKEKYPNDEIIFANGGDRTAANIPEMVCKDIIFKFGVGGVTKLNSSSWILEEWKSPRTERPWGYYRVLHEVPGCKVKELTVEPGQSLSMQRHRNRQEFWHVLEGACEVDQAMASGYTLPTLTLSKHDQLVIPQNDWHRIRNPFEQPCQIIEIQYGSKCEESDIERLTN